MRWKIISVLCFIVTMFAHSSECDQSQVQKTLINYQWYTEDYPPYNYHNDQKKLIGIYPEILALIYQELNIQLKLENIELVPWARLFDTLQNSTSHAAFNMLKTPERDKKFKLISLPILTRISVLVLKENQDILTRKHIENMSFSVVREDIGEHLLDEQFDVTNKLATSSANNMLNMLVYRRVEAIAYSDLVASFQLNKLGYKNKEITSIYTLNDEFKTAFIFHRDTSVCVEKTFKKAISALERKGEIEKVVRKYQH